MLMTNNFSKCREWVPRGTSQHKWRWLTTLLLILTLGIGQMWAATTIFSMTIDQTKTTSITAKETDNDKAITDATYSSGASAVFGTTRTGSSGRTISLNKGLPIGSAADIYIKLNLSSGEKLKEGDVIQWEGTANKEVGIRKASDLSSQLAATVSHKYTIPKNSPLIDQTVLHIFRNTSSGSSTTLTSVTITRPDKITLNANSGTVDGETSIIVSLVESALLPRAVKSNLRFIGWYDDPTAGTLKAGAYSKYTPNGDVTLYAHYADDCISDGELYTFSIDPKPAADIKAAAVAGSVVELVDYAACAGKGTASIGNNSAKQYVKVQSSDGKVNISGQNSYLMLELSCPLQEGDEISFVKNSATVRISYTSNAASGTYTDLTSGTNLYTVPSESDWIGKRAIYCFYTSGGVNITSVSINRPAPAATHTLAWDFDGGSTTSITHTAAGQVAEGATITYPADNTMSKSGSVFDGWSSSATEMPASDLTITAQWATAYTVTFAANGGGGTMDPRQYKATAEVPIPDCGFSPEDGDHAFTHWTITGVPGKTTGNPGETFDMPAGPVTLTAQWAASYGITKGSHTNGDFTIDPTSAAAGTEITLAATPGEGYLFGAWEVVKTSDGTDAGVTVTNNKFEMPAFAVTVNATFVTDTRKKILYVTGTAEETVKANDKLYAALKDDYRVTIVGPTSDADQTSYDLVVLHESVGGGNYGAAAVAAAKAGNTPVLNTKTYFYGNTNDASQRWQWGAPNAGQTVNGATLNSAYCNVASHPLFSGVTMTAGFFAITDVAAAKCMQPIGSFTSGKEGYILATTPNAGEGNGCAIHELTPAQRGASAGKYLMISVSNAKLDALNANGQKLFKNAADYLTSATTWDPISVPTSPEVTATPSENYTEGNTITLTASATGTSASTTYTWYKGDNWAEASATTPVQAAATAASDGNVFTKTAAVEDAGTYWCNISNGTSCDAQASVTITVSSASTPTHTISYDNVKGADMTAYPTEYTEGIGVASFDPLADITGWHFVEWSPASIATDATTDQTITAVWTQIFDVTFNMQDHGAAIDAQHILDGGKATRPDDPIAIGYDFGGWYKEAACTNAWDFANDVITEDTELFAKWTAFTGCVEVYPAASGDALTVDATVALQSGSTGATIKVANLNGEKSIDYNAYGLSFSGGGKDSVRVTLNNDLQVGSVITVRLVSNGTTNSSGRGLNLFNAAHVKKALLGWQASEEVAKYDELSFSYTVTETDGFAGTNVIGLGRQNSVFLKSLKVSNCGAAITYHNLTSEVNIAGMGTVTLGASSVREGYTTTATYSEIDPAYEFVNWTVSGAGASVADATANPATITMGTEDAVVTLNLQLIPVKFTVNYFDGTTPMGTEQVAVNEHPTASEIETAKRHYTFLGWSLTDGGDIVALNTITRTEATTVDLFAKYEAIPCPTSGTIFSMEFDETKKPGETVTIAKDASIDLAEYATISGGNAMIINGETSGKDAISTGGEFLLKATKEVMKIELNCVLQEGDIIRIPDNSAKLVISTSNAKTGTYQAFADKNTHEFAVTAAWAGVDDIYVLYDGSSLKFTKVYVIRPAKYTVSFNMMGHGSAISDLEDVLEGSKISAPTAPTDADYSFAGWYKENTLENEWKFDVDVVETNTTLYAKWLDKSDATLKSLKYGETEIALEAGVYTYNVSLPAFTSAVPALTAETSNPNATKVIANAAAFDSEGNATSTVTVTPEVGADQVYYVNFAKGVEILLQDVTGSITWNFANAVTGTVNITGTPQVLANYGGVTNDNTFESDKLEASGEKFTAGSNANLRANYIRFHTTVPGKLSISYSNTGGSNPARYIYVNGVKYDEDGSASTTKKGLDTKVFVPAGDVELVMKDGEGASKNVQIYQMIFNATPDYTRPVTEGRYGTICLPNGGVMTGASIYTLAYYGETSQKIFFDEVVDGTMEAGKPYLFLPNEGIDRIGVFYTDAAGAEAQTVNGFVGYIGASEDPEDALPVPAGDGNYIVQNNQYREILAGATAYILSHRAYIHFAGINTSEPAKAPGARRIGISGAPQVVTGVDGLNVGDQPVKLIIDGQMYILRGDKMYDATGRLVK